MSLKFVGQTRFCDQLCQCGDQPEIVAIILPQIARSKLDWPHE
jgi:hypothetical protein